MPKQSRETRQKEAIKSHLEKMGSFFTSDDLFRSVSRDDSKIGIATIYRFLKELRKKDMICAYTCDKKTIYSAERKSHCHFVCEKCQKIEHLGIDSIDFLRKKIKGEICHFQIDVHGICERCDEGREK